MKKSRFSEVRITYLLRQAERSTSVADVCRKLGVGEASFCVRKKQHDKLDLTELRELRQLHDENAKLKKIVADLSQDKTTFTDIGKKSGEGAAAE